MGGKVYVERPKKYDRQMNIVKRRGKEKKV